MLFDLNGNTYQVKFFRNNLLLVSSRATIAELWIKDGDGQSIMLLSAESYCNPKDRFEKSKGRKIALAKLLKDAGKKAVFLRLSKEDRAKIWEIYFKEHKK